MGREGWASTSDRYLATGQGDAWAAEAAETGQRGSQHLLDVAIIPAPAEVAAALKLPPGDQVIVRRRLILADDHPVELADSYYPAEFAQHTALADKAKIPGGAVTLLTKLGFLERETREELAARPATAAERELLHLEQGAAILVLTRTLLEDGDRPYEHSVMVTTRHQRYTRRTA